MNDTRPTPTWRTGEVLEDRYAIPVAAHAPPGTYTIEVGMYDPASGTRVPVLTDGGDPATDRVLVTELVVEAP